MIGFTLVRIICISSCLLLAGCGIIPWQLSIALNGADLVSASTTNKTLGEHAVSSATGKDCQWYRLLDGEKACMNKEEELKYLLSKNCDVNAFNVRNIPLVKEEPGELLPECKEVLMRVEEPEELDNFSVD